MSLEQPLVKLLALGVASAQEGHDDLVFESIREGLERSQGCRAGAFEHLPDLGQRQDHGPAKLLLGDKDNVVYELDDD